MKIPPISVHSLNCQVALLLKSIIMIQNFLPIFLINKIYWLQFAWSHTALNYRWKYLYNGWVSTWVTLIIFCICVSLRIPARGDESIIDRISELLTNCWVFVSMCHFCEHVFAVLYYDYSHRLVINAMRILPIFSLSLVNHIDFAVSITFSFFFF